MVIFLFLNKSKLMTQLLTLNKLNIDAYFVNFEQVKIDDQVAVIQPIIIVTIIIIIIITITTIVVTTITITTNNNSNSNNNSDNNNKKIFRLMFLIFLKIFKKFLSFQKKMYCFYPAVYQVIKISTILAFLHFYFTVFVKPIFKSIR